MTKGALLAAAAALTACATQPPPRPRTAQPERPEVSRDSAALADRDWGLLSSQRFLLSVPVPEATAWTVDDRTERWLVASHRSSQSTLLVRSWREGSVVDHRACENAARLGRPDLFGQTEAELMDRRPVGAPPKFDTEVGFMVRRDGGAVRATAALLGANLRRCIALVFVTRIEGADAERIAAERLVFATTRILSRVESGSIEDRVKPAER